jgi:hypothetical protein
LARQAAEAAAHDAEKRVVELEKAAELRNREEAAARRTSELEKRAEVEALAATAISMSSAIDTMTRLEKEKSAEAKVAADAEVMARLAKAQVSVKQPHCAGVHVHAYVHACTNLSTHDDD